MVRSTVALSLLLLSTFLGVGWSQSDPDAGILPFSTQAGGPLDSIDLATSSITFMIPLRSKVGKIPVVLRLVDGSHAYIGSSWGTTPAVDPLQVVAADLGATVRSSTALSEGCPSTIGEDVIYTYTAVCRPNRRVPPVFIALKVAA
jgi:hypothetical protein